MSRKRSEVWLHYKEVCDKYAKCKMCTKTISYKGGGCSNLRKHLYTQHPGIPLKKVKDDKAISDEELPPTKDKQTKLEDFNIAVKMSKSTEKKIDESLLKMITKDLQPLSIVENEGFREYSAALNPNYKIPSRGTLTRSFLPKEYESRVLLVKEMFKNTDSVCITTDGWTSISNESYISLTAHFISNDWKQKSVFVSCFKTTKDHTAENLKNEICSVLRDWMLDEKVTCVLSDNAANIVCAIKRIGWTQLSCLAHTLHLVVMDAIKMDEINVIVTKCKSAVEYFNRSTKASNKLKEVQKQMGKKTLKMINSTPTRWNSTLKMMERIVDNQEPLEATVAILHNPISLFSTHEWEIIKDIILILQPFNEITVEMSGETYTTISKVLVLIRGLKSFLIKKQNVESKEECLKMLERLTTNLNRRFHNIEYNEIYAISSFLDPRFKAKSFDDASALKLCKEKIVSRFENSFTNVVIDSDISLNEDLKEISIWEDFDKTASINKNFQNDTFSEIEQYLLEDILQRKKCPLKWWKKKGKRLP